MNTARPKELDQSVQKPAPTAYSAEKARQGVIILDRPWRLVVFFGALLLLVLLAILLRIAG
jgi:hypothetical protein